jgi:integrase
MRYTFKSIFSSEFGDYLKLVGSSGQRITGYCTTFKKLDIYMIEMGLCEKKLTGDLIDGWLGTLECRSHTKRNRIGHLRRFARYLAALEIPAYEPDLIRSRSDYVAHIFTNEEFEAIIVAADNLRITKSNAVRTTLVFPVLLRILYGCGLRVGEALNMCWDDVDLNKGVITIREAKNKKQRLVPISESLNGILMKYYDRQLFDDPQAQLLFESSRIPGRPYLNNTFRIWFSSILELAGIPNTRSTRYERIISPHCLRHYFVFKSFMKSEAEGRSLEQTAPYLSTYLGHNNLYETERYLSTDYTLYESSQKRLNESIGGLFPEVEFE